MSTAQVPPAPMTVKLTDQDFAKLKALTAEVVRIFGDNWPLEYDTDEDEVVCRYEDEDAPFTDVFITLFRTSQWMPGEPTSPLAEFLAVSPKVVPALLCEVERLRDAETRLEQIRAAERVRCVTELRTHSAERMASAIPRFASGDDDALATVRYASTIEAAARFLESGELGSSAAPAPITREVAAEIVAHLQTPDGDERVVDGPNGGA